MTSKTLLAGLWASLALASPATAGAQSAPPDSPQAKSVVALVEKAAALVDQQGKAAFPEFRKKGSEWYEGNIYLFAYDMKANEVFNAAFPEREGQNRASQKDVTGKPMVTEFIKTAETKGSGWVDYMFPKPGQTQPSRKWAYVRRVTLDGTPAFIAAGFYPD